MKPDKDLIQYMQKWLAKKEKEREELKKKHYKKAYHDGGIFVLEILLEICQEELKT